MHVYNGQLVFILAMLAGSFHWQLSHTLKPLPPTAACDAVPLPIAHAVHPRPAGWSALGLKLQEQRKGAFNVGMSG